MKEEGLLKDLVANGLISSEQRKKIALLKKPPVLSLFWEIRTLIFVGVITIISVLGKILHDNFFNGLHTLFIIIMCIAMIACFLFCFKHVRTFSKHQIKDSKPAYFDIILIGATTLFLAIEGYLFSLDILFNSDQNLAILPTLVFLTSAYFFDDRNILFKGLVGITAWFSISYKEFKLSFVEAKLFTFDVFSEIIPVTSSIILGLTIIGIAYLGAHFNFKSHFKNRYLTFSLHLILVAICASIFAEENLDINTALLVIFGIGFHLIGRKEKLNTAILFSFFYAYIGISYYIFEKLHIKKETDAALYIIITSLGFLFYFFRFIKKHEL